MRAWTLRQKAINGCRLTICKLMARIRQLEHELTAIYSERRGK